MRVVFSCELSFLARCLFFRVVFSCELSHYVKNGTLILQNKGQGELLKAEGGEGNLNLPGKQNYLLLKIKKRRQ